MDGSIKAAQGIAEKLPASLTAPLMLRVIFPGLLISALFYPFLSNIRGFWTVVLTFKINGAIYSLHSGPVLLILSSLLWGAVITTLNSLIYGIYSGRLLWPHRLETWMTQRHEAKVRELQKKADSLKSGRKYNLLWYKLRAYPIGADGDPHAIAPTLLGNIVKEFEEYPKSRYGMDGAFYWKRIWLSLDKDRRNEIDSKWCLGDGLLYISAICNVGGVLWLLVGLIGTVGWPAPQYLPFHSEARSALAGVVFLLLGLLLYIIDLPFQRNNGDIFKIVFDLYRPQLTPLLSAGIIESQRWRGVWEYLGYLLVQCVVCKNRYSALLPRCDICNYVTSLSIQASRAQERPADNRFSAPLPLMEAIRQRAYEIYEQRQGKAGYAREDWERAESELMMR